MNPLPKLTVICPVHEEEQTIGLFYERLKRVFEKFSGQYQTALLFVDNDSQDGTRGLIAELREQDPQVFVITLTRNFGYQVSVECGLEHARGDIFVIIDVDCEDPPEMIVEFLQGYEEEFDIVYGERVDRPESFMLKSMRKLFYRLTRAISDDEFIKDMAEFCMLTAEVRDAIVQDYNSYPFVRASIGRVGFRRRGIPYKRQKRIAGESHYNLIRMTVFAIGGILSSSTLLLRLAAYVFPFWTVIMVGLGFAHLIFPNDWIGPLFLFFGFFFCGSTLTAISIYVARIYRNGLQRPNYFINRKFSFPQT